MYTFKSINHGLRFGFNRVVRLLKDMLVVSFELLLAGIYSMRHTFCLESADKLDSKRRR